VIPQEFVVDDMESIQNPVGMTAIRLEAKIHIVTGAVSSARNLVKCCNKAGLEVCEIVLEIHGLRAGGPECRRKGTGVRCGGYGRRDHGSGPFQGQ
jgi:hypothetical protein